MASRVVTVTSYVCYVVTCQVWLRSKMWIYLGKYQVYIFKYWTLKIIAHFPNLMNNKIF